MSWTYRDALIVFVPQDSCHGELRLAVHVASKGHFPVLLNSHVGHGIEGEFGRNWKVGNFNPSRHFLTNYRERVREDSITLHLWTARFMHGWRNEITMSRWRMHRCMLTSFSLCPTCRSAGLMIMPKYRWVPKWCFPFETIFRVGQVNNLILPKR